MGSPKEGDGNAWRRTCTPHCSACALRARCLALLWRLQALSPASSSTWLPPNEVADPGTEPKPGDPQSRVEPSGVGMPEMGEPGLVVRGEGVGRVRQGGKLSSEAARRLRKLIQGEAKSWSSVCFCPPSQDPESHCHEEQSGIPAFPTLPSAHTPPGLPASQKTRCSNLPHLESLVAALESPLLTSAVAVQTWVGPRDKADDTRTACRRQGHPCGHLQGPSASASEMQGLRRSEGDTPSEKTGSASLRQYQDGSEEALSRAKVDVIGVAGGGVPVWVCMAPTSSYTSRGCRSVGTGACCNDECTTACTGDCNKECTGYCVREGTEVCGTRGGSGNREEGSLADCTWNDDRRVDLIATAECSMSMRRSCDGRGSSIEGSSSEGLIQRRRGRRGGPCGACKFIQRLQAVLAVACSLQKQPPTSAERDSRAGGYLNGSGMNGCYSSASRKSMDKHGSSAGAPRVILVVIPQSEGRARGEGSLKRRLESVFGATTVPSSGQEEPRQASARGGEQGAESQPHRRDNSDSGDFVIVLNELASGEPDNGEEEGEVGDVEDKWHRKGDEKAVGGEQGVGDEDIEEATDVEGQAEGEEGAEEGTTGEGGNTEGAEEVAMQSPRDVSATSHLSSIACPSQPAVPMTWLVLPVPGLSPAERSRARLEAHCPMGSAALSQKPLNHVGPAGTPVCSRALSQPPKTEGEGRIASAGTGAVAAGVRETAPSPQCSPQGPAPGLSWGLPLLNLDVTALVALVSHLSHGGAQEILCLSQPELVARFRTTANFMREQAEAEVASPMLTDLARLAHGRRLVACASAVQHFQGIVLTVGGAQEQHRAGQILQQVNAFPHLPCTEEESLDQMFQGRGQIEVSPDLPSAELQGLLLTSRRIKPLNVTVFSHGSSLLCPTLTSNTAFLRASQQAGAIVAALVHRPCALMGA